MRLFKRLTKIFFLAFLIAFPFGQFSRLEISFLRPEARLYLTDVLMFLAVLSWLGSRLATGEKNKIWQLFRPVFAFFLIGFSSLLLSLCRLEPSEVLISSFYLIRWLAYAGLGFLVFDLSRFAPFKPARLFPILTGVGVLVAIFGLIQYAFWPDLRFTQSAGWDPHYFRVVSTFMDPGFTGLILVFTLSLIVALFSSLSNSAKEKKIILFFAGLIVYLSLALTYSRSSFLAFLVAATVWARLKRSLKFFLLALLLLFLTLVCLPRRPGGEGVRLERWASIEARIENWQHSLSIFKDYPLLGVGFNTYRYFQRDYGFLTDDWQENHAGAGADASLLFVLATTGLVGFGVYLWLWREIFQIVFKKRKSLPNLAGAVLAAFIGLWAHSFFLNSQFYPWLMALVWLMTASLAGAKKVDS